MGTQRILRAYARASDRRRRALNGLNACFDGFWLGLLDRDALDQLDEHFYSVAHDEHGGRVFSYREDAHNRSGLHDWEHAAIERHFPARGRVLVTGAGGGREVLALLQRGYDAVGYEPNGTLVAAGEDLLRRLGHEARVQLCERDTFPDRERADAVVVGWGSYMLIRGRARRVAILRAARATLPDGGPVAVLVLHAPSRRPLLAILAATANALRRLRRREPVEVGDTIAENFVHRFTREEIGRELRLGGFRMVAFAQRLYGHAVALAEPPR